MINMKIVDYQQYEYVSLANLKKTVIFLKFYLKSTKVYWIYDIKLIFKKQKLYLKTIIILLVI